MTTKLNNEELQLQPGDMVYFESNLATGILLERFWKDDEPWWKYLLRSPRRSNLQYFLVNHFETPEDRLLSSIKDGQFEYYAGK